MLRVSYLSCKFCVNFIEIIVSLFLGKQYGKKQKSIVSPICTVKIYSAVKCSQIYFLTKEILCVEVLCFIANVLVRHYYYGTAANI